MSGGLFDPLGTGRSEPARKPPVSLVLAGVAAIALIALLVVSYLRDDGDRGRPIAVVPIERAEAPPKPPAPPPSPVASVPASGPAGPTDLPVARVDQDVEIQNGVRIVRPRRSTPGRGGETIEAPNSPASH